MRTVLALAAAGFVMAGAWPAHATNPTVASIERYCVPGPCPTNTTVLIWVVSFSEKVKQVDQSDFALGYSSALGAQPILSVVAADTRRLGDGVGESRRWELTLSGDSLKGYEGTVTLSFARSPTIQNVAGNTLTSTRVAGTDENTYVLGTPPSVTSITRTTGYPPSRERTTSDTLKWQVTFNEDVQDVDATDFEVSVTTATLAVAAKVVASVTSKTVYDVTASGGDLADLDATVTLGFASGQNIVNDPAGVALTNTTPTGANKNSYVVDNTVPTLVSIKRQSPGVETTAADVLTWRVTFSEPVFDVWADVGDVDPSDDFNDFNVTIDPAPTNAPTLKTERVGGYDAQNGNPFYPVSKVFDLTLYGGDLATLDGTVTLTTSTDCSFWDTADIWALGLVPGFGHELTCSGVAPTPTGDNHNTFVVSNPAPTVAITGVPAATGAAFTATFTFSHAVTGFEVGEITLTGATASNFTNTVPGTVWTALITPTADYSVSVAADAAFDAADKGNTASAAETGTYDTTVPGITITGVPARANGAFTATFTFSRAVTGFVAGDITLTSATASSFTETVTGTTWTALITPTADYSVSVAAGVATDAADNTKSNTASATTHSGAYDTTAPTVEITGVQHIPDTGFTVTFTFSEAMRDFVVGDITLVNATASAFTETVAGTAWSALITPTLDGLFYVSVEADAATDLAGNGNKGSTIHSGTFSNRHPRVESIKRHNPSTSPTGADALTWRVTFDEDVTNVYATVFRLSGTTATLSVAAVVADGVTSKTVYDVTASGGDLANYNGTVTLSFAANSPIVNEKDYTLVDPTPIGANEPTYVVKNDSGGGSGGGGGGDGKPALTGIIADQELTQGVAYTSAAAFPAATGGDGTISYSVAGLPGGVTLNSDRKLSGTASAPLARTALTYTATDSVATEPDSATLTFNISVAPKQPEGFTATAGNTEVTLGWTAIGGVTGWEVQPDGGSWTAIAGSSAATNSHTVTGLTNGTEYTFKVRAFVGDGSATPSTRVDGVESAAESTTPAVPDLVPALSGPIADQKLTQGAAYTSAAAFPAATGGDGTITYSVAGLPSGVTLGSDRKLSGTASAPLARTALTYTATDSHATEPDSATLTFNISVAPQKPADFTATVGDTEVTLSWTAIAGVTGWEVQQDGGSWTAIAGSGASTNSHTVTGLTNGTEYTFKVRAFVGDSSATPSTRVDGVESDAESATPDSVPTLSGAIADQELTQDTAYTSVAAFPAATGGDGAITYSVAGLPDGITLNRDHKLTGTASAPLARTALTYTATDSDATDADSATLTFDISVRPKAVTLSGSAGDGAVHLTWTAIAGVTKWQIEQDGGRWTAIANSDASTASHTVTALTNGTEYTFRARAVVGSGDRAVAGGASNQVSATPDGTAPTVTSIARQDPSGSPTNADRLTWRVTFSEGVTGVDAADFSVTGTTATVTAAAANETSSTAWDVTVSGGDLANLDDTVTLGFASGYAIEDLAGNALIDATPTTGTNENTYVLDNVAPTVAISGVPGEADGPFTATFTFSEPVTGFEVGDITVTGAKASGFSGSGKTYAATITPSADYRVAVAADVAMDAAGNGNRAATPVSGVYLDAAERRALKGTLAGFARATLSGATATLGRRFESAPGATALTLGGVRVALNGARTSAEAAGSVSTGDPWSTQPASGSRGVDSDMLLGRSAFAVPLGAAGDGERGAGLDWTIWGGGDLQQFEGTSSPSRHDGSLMSGWFGVDVDVAAGRILGVAVSHSRGEADYRVEARAGGGALDISLTALWAYLQLGTLDGPRARVLGGVGVGGEAEHRPDQAGRATERAGLSMGLASVSGQWPVARIGAVALALTGDAGVVNMETAGSGTATAGLEVRALQFRGGVEVKHDGFAFGGDGGDGGLRLTPFGSLLLRHDGGDGTTGTGAEIEGGFSFGAAGARFGVDARGRWLALHSAAGARDWGLGLNARLAPAASGHGLSFSVGPRWGTLEGGALEGEDVFADDTGGTPGAAALSLRAGYGFGAGPGVLTPFAQTDLGGGSRSYAAGLGYRAPGGVDARLTGEQRAPETGKADLRIGFDLRLTF